MQFNSLKLTTFSPIRFEKDVNVSKLWKFAENLIDFGGKGHRVVSLKTDGRLVTLEDPKQKLSFLWLTSTVLKISALALTYMSMIGGIIHLSLILYNRKNYVTVNTAILNCTNEHATDLRGKELDTSHKIRMQLAKDCERDTNLALNGQLLQKPENNQNNEPYHLLDFPLYSEFGLDETMFEKIALFSQQGTKADALTYIAENFPHLVGSSGESEEIKEDIIPTVADLTSDGNDMILKVTFPLAIFDKNKFYEGIKYKKANAVFTKEFNLTRNDVPVTLSLSKYTSE